MAAGMGVMALGFLSAALYLALIEPLGAAIAALVTGGVLVAIAASLLLAIKIFVLRPRRAPEPSAQPDGQATAARLGEMLGEEGTLLIKRHPGAAMLVALAAGFVVGSSPKIRARLANLLK
jgi:hypothetical protein